MRTLIIHERRENPLQSGLKNHYTRWGNSLIKTVWANRAVANRVSCMPVHDRKRACSPDSHCTLWPFVHELGKAPYSPRIAIAAPVDVFINQAHGSRSLASAPWNISASSWLRTRLRCSFLASFNSGLEHAILYASVSKGNIFLPWILH